ncbi:bifunctional glutamate N-acetyltransferase/amino-acid acetyltransferase ArgJ [Bifidobacterium sp. ESL0764]|uniref:bifunctional glutamate N-acetyltransferase/amino-acid acetyltransferase ArgJ n=1 Tax=Bifidobacterium sp. ESL0764 TaxID=2983228 RepID=UPI0023F8D433|nr:bifunctional glutamate N-acetyltransferase/amino-acid acetyltransferase ArgJ [Bifidobacterium sp. ESL0764]WEV66477.1 bifunctional glutamate N-acetyltransferase/amino-acid acetyltransferase ArgJ [Bifidobacterium sp. ESL0764]
MSVTFAEGFSAAGVNAGISSNTSKSDLALVVNEGPLDAAAGVFTSNRFCAAPVQWSREAVADGHIKAVVLNSGGANACTGEPGLKQSEATAVHAAEVLSIGDCLEASDIAVCSTGLIGELLPLDNVLSGIDKACEALSDDVDAGMEAATAIMTTDTKPKTVKLEGSGYRIGGMVKGSGMIAPQLATMLCVITTDAVVDAAQLQTVLAAATEQSFDRIDVDGCMSTNDTVLLLASGASGVTPKPQEFSALVHQACASLARQIIGDGEGSSHDIKVSVSGAETEGAALACARAVAGSNLLKCAIYGNDPNWGRIVSSLGTVPVDIAAYDAREVTVDINGVRVCEHGGAGADRSEVKMDDREVNIDIDLNQGRQTATVWTDDLTGEYVHINADYES